MSDEQWYVVCDEAGNSVSIGTVVADPLPAGMTAIALRAEDAGALLSGAGAWDAASLSVQPIPVPVPTSVTARQIRLWLVRHGVSLSAVDAAIDWIPDAQVREECRVEWDYAPWVERRHPMLVPLAAALGLSEAQVDEAFREAATI
jgi:hypothetical protein